MSHHKVFLVGESVFAESLYLLLAVGEDAKNVILFPGINEVLDVLASQSPDILILVDQGPGQSTHPANLEDKCQNIPMIWANHQDGYLRLDPRARIPSTREGLMQAIELMAGNR